MSDDTAAIQALVNAAKPGDTVTIPAGRFMINGLVGADNFMAGGLFLKSNMTLQLAPGAVLQAIPNSSTHYTIITVHNANNVRITGPGSIIGDRDTRGGGTKDIGGVSQWGFGIAVWDSSQVIINNITVAKLWGDGITTNSTNQLLIDHVITDSCRRQNISIGPGNGITITNSTFKNANFSGLDLELDLDSYILSNVLIQYNSFTNSGGPAHIGVGSPVGTYKNIVIKDCQFDLKMQPIFCHDRGGNTGTPWWAFLLNRMFYQGLHLPTYRFVGYPQSWAGP